MVDQQHERPADLHAASPATSQAGRDVAADEVPTDEALQRELDTLGSVLRSPPPTTNKPRYVDESGCQRVVELVAPIGRDPSVAPDDAAEPGDESQVPPMESLGQYKLLAKLGKGGMGAVYKAWQTRLQRVVALKILPAEKLKDKDAVARFDREMRAVGQLDHPNIIAAHDAGEIDGNHYLVMELVDGMDLSILVQCLQKAVQPNAPNGHQARHESPGFAETPDRRVSKASDGERPEGQPECEVGRIAHSQPESAVHSQPGTPAHGEDGNPPQSQRVGLPIPEACEIICQAAAGLQHAHEHGMVHRDIKPSNLMLTQDGTIKILDLGLALLGETRGDDGQELTNSRQTVGTLAFIAPEQSFDSHNVDIRADIYSLGATLYKLMSGEPIYAGPQYSKPGPVLRALHQTPAPPIQDRCEGVPDKLAGIIHKMIAKNRDDRFASPSDVAAELAPFAAGANLAHLIGVVAPDGASGSPVAPRSVRSTTSLGKEAVAQDTAPTLPAALSLSRIVHDGPNSAVAPSTPSVQRHRRILRRPAIAAGIICIVMFAAVFTVRTRFGTNVERTVAQRVLDTGGAINIHDDGAGEIWVMPAGAFRIQIIYYMWEGLPVAPVADADIAALDGLTLLQGLHLHGKQVTDKSLSEIAKHRHMAWLGLYRCAVTDAGMPELAKLRRLTFLDLTGAAVTDDGLSEISKLQSLSTLDLDETAITDAGVETMATNCPGLKGLSLRATRISDTSIKSLTKFTRLERLSLAETEVTEDGVLGLRDLPPLRNLSLSATNIRFEARERIEKGLPQCTIEW